MKMSEKAVLTDCLESLKHASSCYLQGSMQCDTDGLRHIMSRLAIDKTEERNAVFNLMHQAGMYETKAAEDDAVKDLLDRAKAALQSIGGARLPVERELGQSEHRMS